LTLQKENIYNTVRKEQHLLKQFKVRSSKIQVTRPYFLNNYFLCKVSGCTCRPSGPPGGTQQHDTVTSYTA